MTIKKLSLLIILIAIKFSAQSENKKSSLTVGTNYQTDTQYMGRKDSINTPLIVPNFNYSFKNGVFANGEVYFNAKTLKLDGGYIALGYELDKENWGASLALSKFFFRSDAYVIRSDVKFSIDGSFHYDADWLTFNFEPTYNIGTKGSLVLAGGISKEINIDEVTDNGDIHFTPKLYLWAGDENIIINHLIKKRKKTISTTNSANKFQLASIEFSLLSEYIINDKFKIIVDPLISFPQNYKGLGGYYATNYPKEIFVLTIGTSYSF
ncbi:MAG: hypothetical protein H7195_01380 [Chryseobacterium sp.]|nr:hypothetical protein [Chryseobacterium sp.]